LNIKEDYLTEEDLRIERGFKKIINKYGSNHQLFAEEENDEFPDCENIWAVDPISGTHTFINGLASYAIVVSHIKNKKVQFAAVYDPSMDELFTAYRGKGAFLNGKPIKTSKRRPKKKVKIMLNMSTYWTHPGGKRTALYKKLYQGLTKFNLYRSANSFAVNYCHVACGRYDGIVALTKDVFPELAGGLILNEAGGIFVNKEGEKDIKPDDRQFVGASKFAFKEIQDEFQKIVK